MVIRDALARLFRAPSPCGDLCRAVGEEVADMALARHFERLAKQERP